VVVISHEAIPSLSWSPMTMGFEVRDKALQRKLFIDKKVQFKIANDESGVYVITGVK
jgi:Cu/Ag efflux protein CusF